MDSIFQVLSLRTSALLLVAVLGGAGDLRSADPNGAASAAIPEALARVELAGVTGPADRVQVCIVDQRSSRGRWLTVGIADAGWLAETYDAGRKAVLLRFGNHTRWVGLRGAAIIAMPVVHLADGRIDHAHMQLTDRQKELKAAMQHWELMEISRLGRLDETPPPAPAGSSAGAAASASQPR